MRLVLSETERRARVITPALYRRCTWGGTRALALGQLVLDDAEEGRVGGQVAGRHGKCLRGDEHGVVASIARGARGEGALVTGGLVAVADRDPRVNGRDDV